MAVKKGDRVRIIRRPGIPPHENLEFGEAIPHGSTGHVDSIAGNRIYFRIETAARGDLFGWKKLVLERNTIFNNVEFL